MLELPGVIGFIFACLLLAPGITNCPAFLDQTRF
jgi:hypothetical protein